MRLCADCRELKKYGSRMDDIFYPPPNLTADGAPPEELGSDAKIVFRCEKCSARVTMFTRNTKTSVRYWWQVSRGRRKQ